MATAAHASGASPRMHGGFAARARAIEWSLRAFIALDVVLLAGYAVACIGYLVGALDGSPYFPLITNALGLYFLLLCCAALALADVRRFRTMLLVISGAHAVRVVCLASMAALHGVSGDLSILQLFEVPAAAVFAAWTAYSLLATALFAALYRWAPAAEPLPGERDVGWQQTGLQAALGVMALVFTGFIVLYVVRGIEEEANFVFVAASVSKDALFLALAVMALIRPARWASLTMVVVVGHLVLVASMSCCGGRYRGRRRYSGPIRRWAATASMSF